MYEIAWWGRGNEIISGIGGKKRAGKKKLYQGKEVNEGRKIRRKIL